MDLKKKGLFARGAVLTACAFTLLMMQGAVAQADSTPTGQTTATNQATTQANQHVAPSQQATTPAQTTNQNNSQPTRQNESQGWLDNVTYANGQLNVSGWHAADASATEPYHYVIVWDQTAGRQLGAHQVATTARPDVQRAYPQIANAGHSGWSTSFNIDSNAWLNDNLQLVSRYSDSAAGNGGAGHYTDFWSRAVSSDRRNLANLDSVNVNNHRLDISGWHATDGSYQRPNHFLILLANGHEVGRQRVTNTNRPDVGHVYGNVYNADHSGWSASFALAPSMYNANLQLISRYSGSQDGNSDYADYWFPASRLQFSRHNYANLDDFDYSNGHVRVSGWNANDFSAVAPYHFLILYDRTANRQVTSQLVQTTTRNDVKRVYPEFLTWDQSGFNADLGALTLQPNHDYALVSRYSTSNAGNGGNGQYQDNWISVGNINQTASHLDSLTQDGHSMHVTGWMASSQRVNRPYAYLIVLNNGQEIGRARVHFVDRPDVARVYPRIYDSLHSGINQDVPINVDRATGNLSVIMRFTDDPAGNGNYLDQRTSDFASQGGWLDQATVGTNAIHVSGWHAAVTAADKPVQLLILVGADGHEYYRSVVNDATNGHDNVARPDVARRYPQIGNAATSGFSADIPITSSMNHKGFRLVHRFATSLADANNAADYNDYWSDEIDVNSRFQHENGGTVYYLPTTGQLATGWVTDHGHRYYFGTDHLMYTGEHYVDGHDYQFGTNGIAVAQPQYDWWGWPFPQDGRGYFSYGQLFGTQPGGGFRENGFHDGLDFGSEDHPGRYIHAVHGGVVTDIGHGRGIEYYLTIDDGRYLYDYQEAFSGFNRILVHEGQLVHPGDIIGIRDTSHLHLGITRDHDFQHALDVGAFHDNGTWLDPLWMISHNPQ